jgi:uncharacterized membrane-anchored protein
VRGPTTVNVGTNATFTVPANYVFLNPPDTQRIMELMQNPSTQKESYFGPQDLSWYALLSYEETGHVPDDEKIDAAPLLESIKSGTELGNQERAKRGWPSMTILGWKYPPFYDPATKRLEWAIDGQSANGEVINYDSRILGRTGVTSAVLVADPSLLSTAVPEFKALIAGYAYVPGQRYTEVKQGDRVAEYGLAALIAGGAAAVATKKGFWAMLAGFFVAAWKFTAAAVIGLLAWARSLFKKKS